MSAPKEKEVPVFSAESIKAMGPAAQGIAEILKGAGWIKVEEPATVTA